MANERQSAISPRRDENYPEWYQQVIKASDIAENSPVRGCMVIKPWGYGIWENIQRELDRRIKATGHENAYFPLFIPLSFLAKEAEHIEGFAKECAVVTHHRLEVRDGKLVPSPDAKLEEPLIVRPTSETIIGEAFSKWIKSYRDLPLLINQWANVVRWEMRTRLFLRTSEFLWQEGHTAHVDEADARREVAVALEIYRSFAEEILAMPVVTGEKSANERFPGAVTSLAIEAMMQDRKALQAGTSHYLGTNFAKAANIQYLDESGNLQYAHTTSWGVSTRLVGGVIMSHGDDDGLRVPPRIAPKHVVILPVIPKPELQGAVMDYAGRVEQELTGLSYGGYPLVVTVDRRDIRGGDKNWQWIKKGIPVRLEVGPRDIEAGKVVLYRRDKAVNEKQFLTIAELRERLPFILDEIQQSYYEAAKSYRDKFTYRDLSTYEELKEFFTVKEEGQIHGGFVVAKWSEDLASVELLEKLKLSIRCIPLEQSGTTGKCILTGKTATKDVVIAKAY